MPVGLYRECRCSSGWFSSIFLISCLLLTTATSTVAAFSGKLYLNPEPFLGNFTLAISPRPHNRSISLADVEDLGVVSHDAALAMIAIETLRSPSVAPPSSHSALAGPSNTGRPKSEPKNSSTSHAAANNPSQILPFPSPRETLRMRRSAALSIFTNITIVIVKLKPPSFQHRRG